MAHGIGLRVTFGLVAWAAAAPGRKPLCNLEKPRHEEPRMRANRKTLPSSPAHSPGWGSCLLPSLPFASQKFAHASTTKDSTLTPEPERIMLAALLQPDTRA